MTSFLLKLSNSNFRFLNSDQSTTPGETGSHGVENNQIPFPYPAAFKAFGQSKRNGRRRRIGLVIYRNNNFFFGKFQFLADTFNNADVCLMRQQPVDIGNPDACLFGNDFRRLRQAADR